jgi:hypothetical protein
VGAGVSDQCKEQIMRSVTYTFAVALLLAVWHISAASAQTPQTETQQAESAAPAISAASISDQKLDAVAEAMQRVARLKRDYLQQLEATPPEDHPRIANEASNGLEKAVTDQDLSVEEYTSILEVALNDPQVRQKIMERMRLPPAIRAVSPCAGVCKPVD